MREGECGRARAQAIDECAKPFTTGRARAQRTHAGIRHGLDVLWRAARAAGLVARPLVLGARSLAQGAKATVLAWMSIAPPAKPVAAAAKTPVACATPSREVCAPIGSAANPSSASATRPSASARRRRSRVKCPQMGEGGASRTSRVKMLLKPAGGSVKLDGSTHVCPSEVPVHDDEDPGPAPMPNIRWNIGRAGRAWTADEAFGRYELSKRSASLERCCTRYDRSARKCG